MTAAGPQPPPGPQQPPGTAPCVAAESAGSVPAGDRDEGDPAPSTRAGRRRWLPRIVALVCLGLLVLAGPTIWLRLTSAGHVYPVEGAPHAPVAIVFGAQLAAGGTTPKPFLAGRLSVAAQLYRDGRVRAILVSGDAHGSSGNEVEVMTRDLVQLGVPQRRIVADPYGLDSYDTCRRAHDVYGVRRALLVSQDLHLPRAVTLCRALGIAADGVAARCDHCRRMTLTVNAAREVPAAFKAAYELARHRSPAVTSAPDASLTEATR